MVFHLCVIQLQKWMFIKLLMSFLVIQVVEVLCYSMWESIIAYLNPGFVNGCKLAVVDKTGKLKGVRIHKKNRKEYSNADNAMIKVFNSMPAWKPGICNGKKVNVLLTQRINVHLE